MSRFLPDVFSGLLDGRIPQNGPSDLLARRYPLQSFENMLSASGSKAGLDSLTGDIIVQYICAYLAVEDIIRLRAVSVRYYNLSHDPYIWKRLLSIMDIKLPPLPPRAQHHNLKMLRSAEVEQMIVRAVSFDSNWRSAQPVTFGFDCFPLELHIVEMVALPGSKHIVASAVNRALERHYLVLYAVDHRLQDLFPLALMQTPALATHLRAQYMRLPDIHDIRLNYEEDGIAIAYIYHEIVMSDSESDEDKDVYTCACQFVRLGDIEPLEDPLAGPGDELLYSHALSMDNPFECIAEIKSTSELGPVDLCTLLSCRYIAVVCKPASIIVQDLCHGTEQGRLILEDFALVEQNNIYLRSPTISHIRVLSDASVLVVGTYDDIPPAPGCPSARFLFVATYELHVQPGMQVTRSFLQQCPYHSDQELQDISISDCHVPISHTSAVYGKKERPPSISVFFRDMKHENDLIEIRLNPNPPYLAKELAYDLENTRVGVYRHAFAFPAVPEEERKRFRLKAIAGHRHVLLMMTLDGKLPFYNFYSLIPLPPSRNPIVNDQETDDVDVEMVGTQVTRVFERPSRGISLARLEIPLEARKVLQRHGVGAYAWDDHTGRLFFNAPSETNMYILSFAQTNWRDFDGHPLARKLDILPAHESYPPMEL